MDVGDVSQTVPFMEFEVEPQSFCHLGQPGIPCLTSSR